MTENMENLVLEQLRLIGADIAKLAARADLAALAGATKTDLAALAGELTLVKWMLGFNLALSVGILWKLL